MNTEKLCTKVAGGLWAAADLAAARGAMLNTLAGPPEPFSSLRGATVVRLPNTGILNNIFIHVVVRFGCKDKEVYF